MNIEYPSKYEIGERVRIQFHGGNNDGVEIQGFVRAIIFTNAKVKYSVIVPCDPPEAIGIDADLLKAQVRAMMRDEEMPEKQPSTSWFTLHNLDSVLVQPYDPQEVVKFEPDIYS